MFISYPLIFLSLRYIINVMSDRPCKKCVEEDGLSPEDANPRYGTTSYCADHWRKYHRGRYHKKSLVVKVVSVDFDSLGDAIGGVEKILSSGPETYDYADLQVAVLNVRTQFNVLYSLALQRESGTQRGRPRKVPDGIPSRDDLLEDLRKAIRIFDTERFKAEEVQDADALKSMAARIELCRGYLRDYYNYTGPEMSDDGWV